MRIERTAVEPLWKLGIIAAWYLHDYQLPIYSFFAKTKNPFFEATRRFGKTTTKLTQVLERSLQNVGRVTLWNEPWKEQARNIVIPEMEQVMLTCPRRLKAKFYRTDSFFEFPSTGSRLYLLGVNEDKGEGARGRAADEIVNDELGSWKDASYIINEVFKPMLLTTRGEMTDMGTPPRDLGHLFYELKARAISEGRYIGRDFDAIETLSQAEKEAFIQTMGGRSSTAVRRELYLEPVSDPESLVIPEYEEPIHDVEDNYERPQYYDRYVGMDLGLNDGTAALFAYADFEKQELVIEDEYVVYGRNTREITDACKAKEAALWGDVSPYMRWGDNELQQLHDMYTLNGYLVNATAKDNREAAINSLRLLFTHRRIKIKKRCENLRYQLKVGLWNERRTDFVRGERTGHLDAVAALIYLARNINWRHNPFPSHPGTDPALQLLEQIHGPSREDEKAFSAFFT